MEVFSHPVVVEKTTNQTLKEGHDEKLTKQNPSLLHFHIQDALTPHPDGNYVDQHGRVYKYFLVTTKEMFYRVLAEIKVVPPLKDGMLP